MSRANGGGKDDNVQKVIGEHQRDRRKHLRQDHEMLYHHKTSVDVALGKM
jgi:hypothetical protein